MNMEKLTRNTQQALQQAQQLARQRQHAEIDCEHLLLALVQDTQGLAPRLLERAGLKPAGLLAALEQALAHRPQVQGRGVEESHLYASVRLQRLLERAEQEAARLKDEYLSVEH
ncbi:MAG: Clp protease N-terminal domain-containing protein, partial [Desulfuromonas thiophila]|nr:Clp protease N-terminal domain-containing protein [Desulfuromonas thiophila]